MREGWGGGIDPFRTTSNKVRDAGTSIHFVQLVEFRVEGAWDSIGIEAKFLFRAGIFHEELLSEWSGGGRSTHTIGDSIHDNLAIRVRTGGVRIRVTEEKRLLNCHDPVLGEQSCELCKVGKIVELESTIRAHSIVL